MVSCSNPFGQISYVEFAPASLKFDKDSYSFGTMGLGSGATATFVLNNVGVNSAIGCGDIQLSDTTNFSIISNTCTSENMNVNETCAVEVLSQPSTLGVKTLTISRQCDLGVEVTTPANQITAEAVTPSLIWSPATHNYGSVYVGSNSFNQVFLLDNTGGGSATGCTAPVLNNTIDFEMVVDTCGTAIMGAGTTCQVTVRARPQTLGNKRAHITRTCANVGITSTTPNGIQVDGVLTNLAWSPLTHDFGTVNVSTNSSTQVFTLSNSGTGDASICGMPTISDTNNFSIITDNCSLNNVSASGSCTVTVQGHPTSSGLKQATLSRTCGIGGTVTTTANMIRVTGANPAGPNLVWIQTSHDYGSLGVGIASTDFSFYLSNNGTADATGCSAPVLSDNVNFNIVTDGMSTNDHTVGSNPYVAVRAIPTSPGLKQATLSRTCTVGGTASTTTNMITVTGVAAPTDLIWDYTSHNFGQILVNSSSNWEIPTLSNSGPDDALNCSNAYLSDSTNFYMFETCNPSEILSGESCQVYIRANPQSAGIKTATISKTCEVNGNPTPIEIFTATVEAYNPFLAWSPLSNDYGTIAPGANSSNVTFTLTNTSSTYTATSCYPPYLGNGSEFTIVSDNCGSNDLAPNGTCTVEVQANPGSAGFKYDELYRDCDFGGYAQTNNQQLVVRGSGPELAFNPNYHNFGYIDPGNNSSNQVLTIENNGTSSATGCGVAALTDNTHFTIVSDGCGSSDIAAGASCNITVRANPTAVGNQSADLERTCASGGYVSAYVEVTGAGPNLVWDTTDYDYGNVVVGDTTSDMYFTLYNQGTADATGCSAPVLGDTTNFTITSEDCSTNDLGSGWSSCNVAITANPTTTGLKQTTLSRTCTVGGVASTTTNGIEVTGILNAPNLAWSPMVHDFGSILVGTNGSTESFTLSNSGTQNATSCTAATLDDNTNFTITWQNCNSNDVSAYGGSCLVYVRANPASYGLKQATLSRTCGVGGTVTTTTNGLEATGYIQANWQQEFGLSNLGEVRSGGGQSHIYKYFFLNNNNQSISNCTAVQLDNTNDFTLLSDDCGTGTMSAQDICTVQVKANPVSIGTASAVLSRSCDETGTSNISIDVIGNENSKPVALSGSGYSACILTASNKLKCWGLNTSYAAQYVNPVSYSDADNAIQVSVGFSRTCVVINDGTVKCGYTTNTLSTVPGISGAVEVATGGSGYYENTCVRLGNGQIVCWGNNVNGQLGDGTNTTSSTPVYVSGITDAIDVAFGSDLYNDGAAGCAVLSDNTVKCWGKNHRGQLGNGTTTSSNTPVVAIGVNDAILVQTNGLTSCAVLSTGQVMCWGLGTNGQLGNGASVNSSTPVFVSGISTAVKVAVGTYAACAVLADGTVRCWGMNSNNIFGENVVATNINNTPVSNPDLTNIIDMSLGWGNACALKNNDSVTCWGSNYYGALSIFDNSYLQMHPPTIQQPYIWNGMNNSISTNGSCNVLADGSVKCWNTATNFVGVVQGINIPLSGPAVHAEGDYTYGGCALLASGAVQCWGVGLDGALGNGGTSNSGTSTNPIAVNVIGVSGATQMSGRCAVLSTGEIKCWGANYSGNLGDGTQTNRSTPVFVSGINNAVKVKSNGGHACAILNDNTVKCWGNNLYGSLGDGTTSSNYLPVTVSGLTDAIDIALVGNRTCALKSDETVVCWGYNGNYGIGDGTNIDRHTPVAVLGLSGIVQLSVSGNSHIALTNAGQRYQWATGMTYLAPKLKLNYAPVTTIFDGGCAKLNTGAIQCDTRLNERSPFYVDLTTL